MPLNIDFEDFRLIWGVNGNGIGMNKDDGRMSVRVVLELVNEPI
jgi:hypothetical protein